MVKENARWGPRGGHSAERGGGSVDDARRQRVVNRADAIMRTALSAHELLGADDVQLTYVLPGLVQGTLGLIVGSGSSSKSMLTLHVAISVALGQDVFHLFPGFQFTRGRVIFLSLEDARDPLASRYQRLLKALPQDLREAVVSAEEQGWIYVIPQLESVHPAKAAGR